MNIDLKYSLHKCLTTTEHWALSYFVLNFCAVVQIYSNVLNTGRLQGKRPHGRQVWVGG